MKSIKTSEKLSFNWHGKNEASYLADIPVKSNIYPQKDKSVNWDNTGNIYIEGDNLEALKILKKDYEANIKVIYIDPPYNTGKDFTS